MSQNAYGIFQVSEQEEIAIRQDIAAAGNDPVRLRKIADLQDRIAEDIERAIYDQSLKLAALDAPSDQIKMGQVINLSALAGAARMRKNHGDERRALAEAMVVGALLNENNPGWDIRDPATHDASKRGLAAEIMMIAINVPPAPVPADE